MTPPSLSQPFHVAIVGAGIGGLALAHGLLKQGHQVTVFERAPQLQEVGAGLTLWRNASAALEELGLSHILPAIGHAPERAGIRTPQGSFIFQEESLAENAVPLAQAVYRVEFQKALYQALPEGSVQFKKQFKHYEVAPAGDAVTLHFSDNSSGTFEALIGADGIHSLVRQQLLGKPHLKYAGYQAWRGITETSEPIKLGGETLGAGKRFGILPLRGNQVYWFAAINAKENFKPKTSHLEFLLQAFRTWHEPIGSLIQSTSEKSIHHDAIYDHPPLKTWSAGPVVILGDAAHPTTPNLGQGACMALEDAAVLSHLFAKENQLNNIYRAYEKIRKPRTTWITKQSRTIGIVGQLENPLLCWLRNSFLKHLPKSFRENTLSAITTTKFMPKVE